MLKAATLADSCKSIVHSNFLLPHWTNMTQLLKFLQKKHYDSRQFDILSLLKKNLLILQEEIILQFYTYDWIFKNRSLFSFTPMYIGKEKFRTA